MPFESRLAVDTLPSGVALSGGFRSVLICFRLSPLCPFRRRHTFHSLRPATHYCRFWIQRSSSERWRDLNPPDQCAAQRKVNPRGFHRDGADSARLEPVRESVQIRSERGETSDRLGIAIFGHGNVHFRRSHINARSIGLHHTERGT